MKLILSRTARHARVRRGHPWVFAGELHRLPPPDFNGKALPLFDERGRHLGNGIVNTDSNIVWRRFSRGEQAWDHAFWQAALTTAIANRPDEPFRRVVWSEGDDMPGLIVDQYEDILVVQSVTRAVDAALPQLLDLLDQLLKPRDILVRNDAPSRKLEGLTPATFTRSGKPIEPFLATLNGIHFFLDLQNLQKTGFYLDQRHEHASLAPYCHNARVLDAFCNQGAFALNCAHHGAREVIGVDSSADAIRLASENARSNNLKVAFHVANMFDFFTQNRDTSFDLIILDPPSFAPNKAALVGAIKGYKELHLRAFKLLAPNGILATYCCSHHVDRVRFRDLIRDAAADAHRSVQIIRESSQPADHPVLLDFPESEYLKGFLLRVRN